MKKIPSYNQFKLDRIRFTDSPRKKHQEILDAEVPMNLIAISEWDAPRKDYPENSSVDVRVELEEMANHAKQLGPKEVKKIVDKYDEDFLPEFYKVTDSAGYDFDSSLLYQWLIKLMQESEFIITKLKYMYNRPRPYQLAPMLGIDMQFDAKDSAKSPSFPSGHTIQAILTALVLSKFFPAIKDELMKVADKICYSRWIGGFHFRSDIEYGKEIANWMFNYIQYPNQVEEGVQPNSIDNPVLRGENEDERLVRIRQFKSTIEDYENYWNDRIKNGNI